MTLPAGTAAAVYVITLHTIGKLVITRLSYTRLVIRTGKGRPPMREMRYDLPSQEKNEDEQCSARSCDNSHGQFLWCEDNATNDIPSQHNRGTKHR